MPTRITVIPRSSKSSAVAWTTGCSRAGDGVVAVEGDVDGAELDLIPAPLLDQAGQPLGDRDAAGVNPDQREPAEVVVALDDLVRDPRERALEAFGVQQVLTAVRSGECVLIPLPFRPLWTGLKGRAGSYRARRTRRT